MEIVAAADSCVPSCGLWFHGCFSQAKVQHKHSAPKMRNSHIHKGSYI